MQHLPQRAGIAASLVALLAVAGFAVTTARADTPPTMYVCRTIEAGETANAKMMASGGPTLVCRPETIELHMSGGSMKTIGRVMSEKRDILTGPDLSKALTPQQINDAYVKFIQEAFNISHPGG